MKKIPKTTLFGHKFKQLKYPLFGAWSLLMVHIWFTPSKGPKGFKNVFFRNWTMEGYHEV